MHGEGTIRDCLFLNNGQTAFGGGAYLSGPITVERCKFVGNDAKFWGGGAYIFFNSVTIRDSLFASNREIFTGDGGAGLACDGTGLQQIERCQFIGNMAIRGGAVACLRRSTARITNCLMGGNLAGASGLAAVMGSYPYVSFCTFYANSLTCVRADDSSDIYLSSCVFSDNDSFDLVENGPNADVQASYCYFDNEGVGILRDGSGKDYNEITETDGIVLGFSNNQQGKPVFPDPLQGTWTGEGKLDVEKFQTTLVDDEANWTPGQFKETIAFVNPNEFPNPNFMVVDNTETTLTVWGDATTYVIPESGYTLHQVEMSKSSPPVDLGPTMGPSTDLFGNPRPIDQNGQGRDGMDAY
ncbi:MAG: right-handed parallel beta-helix repeat-containing protein, partial [Candidatus Omnitrophica bacterium]|nr:right-handed parallel beta-helix repeat-containing protein [Candidatus Omnitrophota bacterium]